MSDIRLGLMNAVAEIEQLRIQLAAAETERDALRDLLREAYEWRDTLWPVSTTVRINAALNKGGSDE